MPTSITTAPGRIHSPRTSPACPTAAITTSARPTSSPRSRVRGVADRHRRVPLEQQQRDRLADEQAPPDDDRARALAARLGLVEQTHHAERRARTQARHAGDAGVPGSPGAGHRRPSAGGNRLDDGVRVEPRRQRELHEDAVHVAIRGEVSRRAPQQLRLRRRRRQHGGRTSGCPPRRRPSACIADVDAAMPGRRRRAPSRARRSTPRSAQRVRRGRAPRPAPPPRPPCRRSISPTNRPPGLFLAKRARAEASLGAPESTPGPWLCDPSTLPALRSHVSTLCEAPMVETGTLTSLFHELVRRDAIARHRIQRDDRSTTSSSCSSGSPLPGALICLDPPLAVDYLRALRPAARPTLRARFAASPTPRSSSPASSSTRSSGRSSARSTIHAARTERVRPSLRRALAWRASVTRSPSSPIAFRSSSASWPRSARSSSSAASRTRCALYKRWLRERQPARSRPARPAGSDSRRRAPTPATVTPSWPAGGDRRDAGALRVPGDRRS